MLSCSQKIIDTFSTTSHIYTHSITHTQFFESTKINLHLENKSNNFKGSRQSSNSLKCILVLGKFYLQIIAQYSSGGIQTPLCRQKLSGSFYKLVHYGIGVPLNPLEQEMATHSSILAWKIPGTEEPGGLMGSQGIRHD